MGKAQKLKEQRRLERQRQSARAARRAHYYRWGTGLSIYALLSAFILPGLYDKYGGDFLRQAPFYWSSQPNAATVSPGLPNPQSSTDPKGTIMNNEKPVMVIETDKGTITVELNRSAAPKTVEHITDLVAKGFYDGIVFHRVVPGFVVQGGDPTGSGSGGSGTNIAFEANDLKHDKGVIAMARSQSKDSADSQFYITLEAQPSLDGEYVVFGKVIDGMEVVEKIAQGDKMTKVTLR